jgi:prephenate dehydrogenase
VSGGGTRLPVIGGARVPGVPPGFERIAIIGIGAIGGSLAMAARQAWPRSLVIGVDTPGVIEAAMRLHAIDVGSDDLMIAGDADLVVLAGGPDDNVRVLPYLPDAIAGEAIVLALGGGDALAERARSLPVRLQVVVGLPSIAMPGSGLHAARADLFHGRAWTMSPVTAGREAVERMHSLIHAIGGGPATEAPSI